MLTGIAPKQNMLGGIFHYGSWHIYLLQFPWSQLSDNPTAHQGLRYWHNIC